VSALARQSLSKGFGCCCAEVLLLLLLPAAAAVVVKQAYVFSAMLASQEGLLKGGTIEFIAGFADAKNGNVSLQVPLCYSLGPEAAASSHLEVYLD
jgi:hypothetical protein